MTSKYDPYIIDILSAFSDPHTRIHEFYIPANFSLKAFRNKVAREKHSWRISQDGPRIVVFNKNRFS